MNQEAIKQQVEQVMKVESLDIRQENLFRGLFKTYEELELLGLKGAVIIGDSPLNAILKEEFHEFIGTTGSLMQQDRFLQIVLANLLLNPVNEKKLKP